VFLSAVLPCTQSPQDRAPRIVSALALCTVKDRAMRTKIEGFKSNSEVLIDGLIIDAPAPAIARQPRR